MTTFWPALTTRTAPPISPRSTGHSSAGPSPTSLSSALDELTEVAARAVDDAPTRAALARSVELLEQAAGAGLGPTGCDPLVVLQRRLGRAAQRLSVGARAGDLRAEQVRAHAAALRCPVPAQRRPGGAPRPVGVPAGC